MLSLRASSPFGQKSRAARERRHESLREGRERRAASRGFSRSWLSSPVEMESVLAK